MSGLRLLLCLTALLAGPCQGATVTVYGSDNLPPKSWNDNGTPRGYAIDAAVEALRRVGFTVDVKLEPWVRAVEDAKAGRGLIAHFSKTPERERIFDFSQPLVFDRIVVVTRKAREFPFAGVKDLIGKRVGVLRGVAYGGDWTGALAGFTREEDTDAVARLGKLARGRLDAAIISSGAAGLKIAAAQAGLDDAQFSILPVPILEDPNYLATAKSDGGAALIARLDAAIAEMRADGTVARIMAGYGDQ
jgi:polar amino acid transport system substrate-binding protein